jgi:hypothetical protein
VGRDFAEETGAAFAAAARAARREGSEMIGQSMADGLMIRTEGRVLLLPAATRLSDCEMYGRLRRPAPVLPLNIGRREILLVDSAQSGYTHIA